MLAFGLIALMALLGILVSVLAPPVWVSVAVFIGFMVLVGWLSEPGRIR